MADNRLNFIGTMEYKANSDFAGSVYKMYYNEFKQIVKLYDMAFSDNLGNYLSKNIILSFSVIPFHKGGIIKYELSRDKKLKPPTIEPLFADADAALRHLDIILQDEDSLTNESAVENVQLEGTVILMAENKIYLLKDSTEDEWSVEQAEDDVIKILKMLKND